MTNQGTTVSGVTRPVGQDHPIRVEFEDTGNSFNEGVFPQVSYLLASIWPTLDEQDESNSPLNLSIVIDRSNSMTGDRLNKVKRAAHLVVDQLRSIDVLSVISYSDRAEVVIEAGQVKNKEQLKARISSMRANGGTEILQGLLAGVKELSKVPRDKYVNHLVLLTDGHTYGDADDCVTLARKAASMGVGISAFGIGSEWNDQFLDQLVGPSGGQTGYIQDPEQIIGMLRQRVMHLGAVYAYNVRMQIALPENFRIKDVYKVTPYAQPVEVNKNTLRLGTIEGGVPITVLIEVFIDSLDVAISKIPYAVRAEVPKHDPKSVMLTGTHGVHFGRKPGMTAELPGKVMEAVRLLNLNRMNESAWEAVEEGDVDRAARKMAFLTKRLEEAGLNELAQTAKAQTVHLESHGKLGVTRRFALKYGTRMELTKSLTMLFNEINVHESDQES